MYLPFDMVVNVHSLRKPGFLAVSCFIQVGRLGGGILDIALQAARDKVIFLMLQPLKSPPAGMLHGGTPAIQANSAGLNSLTST